MAERLPRRARANPEVRRAQILDEAVRVIGRSGYHGFTVLELAKRCGVTNGALLYYFGSKEQLLAAVLEEHDQRLADAALAPSQEVPSEQAEDEPPRGDCSRAAVLARLRPLIERAAADPELTHLQAVLQQEALDPAHPAHGYFEARERSVLEAFARIVAPHVAARELFAMMQGLEQRWLRAGRAFDLPAAWDQAVAKLLPTAN